jgi:superoxide dismutase
LQAHRSPLTAHRSPLTTTGKALLKVDAWEHACHIDYRNVRPKFVKEGLNNSPQHQVAAV